MELSVDEIFECIQCNAVRVCALTAHKSSNRNRNVSMEREINGKEHSRQHEGDPCPHRIRGDDMKN